MNTHGRSIVIGLVASAFGGMLVGCSTDNITEKDHRPIALAEVRALMTGKEASRTLLVDSRLPEKFDEGHIPGARNVQLADARARTGNVLNPQLAEYKNLVVYGEDPGAASPRALTTRLMQLGHKGVRIFEGGYAEWLRAGLGVDRTSSAPK
ncbi:MAG: rhodanese-like domain-containing protein [Phycisphaerales bacterium]